MGLRALRKVVRIPGAADIGNTVFKLHYLITTAILLGFCLLVTVSGLTGNPITCMGAHGKITEKFVNAFCWNQDTYKLSDSENQDSPTHPFLSTDSEENIYKAYYRWVPFVLFIQAILFYLPRWVWKSWEGNKINSLTVGLSNPLTSNIDQREEIGLLADYLISSLHSHNLYTIKFIVCEALNLINVIVNMFLLDKLIGHTFFTHPSPDDSVDSMALVFPKMTTCLFYIYSGQGTRTIYDFVCTMSLNIINAKINAFLWFWFCFLSIVSGFAIIYRIIVVFTPIIRMGLLKGDAKFKHENVAVLLSKNLSFGDFFLLHLIGKNVQTVSFSSLIYTVYFRLDSDRNVYKPDIELAVPRGPEQFRLMQNQDFK